MEKRSHRRIRDLDVLTAFQGLVANEIGCARISMMASEQETLPQWAEYRCARPIISRSSTPACTARPVHTEYMVRRVYDPEARRYLENTFLAEHRRTGLGPYRPGERLGTASTVEETKAIAQAAHDKARASTRGESL